MRFAAALLFGVASAQVAIINGVMGTINTQVNDLNTAIQGLKQGDNGDTVIAASDKILKTTADGLTTVANAQAVPLLDAVQIQGTVQTLTDSLKKTIDSLIAKKPIILSSGQGQKTETTLQAQLDGATKLAKAISAKVPPEVSELAITLSGDILKQIQRGLDAFAGSPAGPAPGAGAGAGAGGASAPAAGAGASIGSSSASVGTTTTSGSAGAAAAGAGASSGMGASMGGASPAMSAGGSSAGAGAPVQFTGAAASMKPASVFGLVAVAAAVLAM